MFRELTMLLRNPMVPLYKKIILGFFTMGYGLLPFDVLPFLPFDDILITLAALSWFIFSAHRDLQRGTKEKTIDAEAEILD